MEIKFYFPDMDSNEVSVTDGSVGPVPRQKKEPGRTHSATAGVPAGHKNRSVYSQLASRTGSNVSGDSTVDGCINGIAACKVSQPANSENRIAGVAGSRQHGHSGRGAGQHGRGAGQTFDKAARSEGHQGSRGAGQQSRGPAVSTSSGDVKGGGNRPRSGGNGYSGHGRGNGGHVGGEQHSKSPRSTENDASRTPNATGGQTKPGPSGSNNDAKRQKPKSTNYEQYWNEAAVELDLKSGQLIKGPIRINPKRYQDAFVPHPDNQSDVFISGLRDRNRALNGDVVCVCLYPEEQWRVELTALASLEAGVELVASDCAVESTEVDLTPCSSAVSDLVSLDAADVTATDTIQPSDSASSVSSAKSNASGDASKSNSENRFTTIKDIRSDHGPCSPNVRQLFAAASADKSNRKVNGMIVRTGKVVFISAMKHTRIACGQIKLMDKQNKQNALFAPNDHRVPRIVVPLSECPPDFVKRPDDFKSTLFISRITEWNESMMMPKGTLIRSLGEAGEIEPSTEGMLIEYGIDTEEFSGKVLSCLPKTLPWSIPQTEFAYRRDLRNLCIFTIDPSTARDLDDSLSCEDLGDGLLEIGVHIADVSFFVEPGTALNELASERTTSVYLVQKVIPMLPHLLCEQLCSLNPGEDRLTFSVIWKMTSAGEIVDEWFGRSVIRSCVKMSYDHAQGFIDEPTREWTTDELPPISSNVTIDDIRQRVLKLNGIALNLRAKRFRDGALRLDQVKLQYTLDKESGLPSGYSVYQQKDSNRMIEEFMLLANMAVAHKIYKSFPDFAVLRRHPPPQTRMLDELEALCQSFGIEIDFSSAGALQRSLSTAANGDEARLLILVSMCSRPMQNALYFCSGSIADEDDYHHYALNVPLYTHFTSPIRRYPDIMVHRLLAAALDYINLPAADVSEIQAQCNLCNDKKLAAKRVSELSSELFFTIFLKTCGPMYDEGIVMNVLDQAFDVLVYKVGIVKRVYCERLNLKEFNFEKQNKKPELTLTWAVTEHHPTEVKQVVTLFESVCCVLTSGAEPLQWHADILHPDDALPNC